MWGTNRGLSSKLNSTCKKSKKQSTVSCQEPSPLKGRKHSFQRHPHDAALVNAHSFVSMGVEARYLPFHSAAHCQHMNRQPSLCHCCPGRGRCHCDCRCHLRGCCRLCCHCHLCFQLLLPLPLPSAIAIPVAANHCHRCLCLVIVSHCHPCCPCHQPLLSPSPLAIAVAISTSHHHCRCRCPFPRVVVLVRQEMYSNNLSKECLSYFILFRQWAAH
jgi:hypothetical protein